jgi:hypothetical protein
MTEHTSYELSKRLHDKGFKGKYEKVWTKHSDWTRSQHHFLCDVMQNVTDKEVFPAYTFTELWGAMPEYIVDDMCKLYLEATKDAGVTYIEYVYGDGFNHESPAEAAGMMVEWLIDNGYLSGDMPEEG